MEESVASVDLVKPRKYNFREEEEVSNLGVGHCLSCGRHFGIRVTGQKKIQNRNSESEKEKVLSPYDLTFFGKMVNYFLVMTPILQQPSRKSNRK